MNQEKRTHRNCHKNKLSPPWESFVFHSQGKSRSLYPWKREPTAINCRNAICAGRIIRSGCKQTLSSPWVHVSEISLELIQFSPEMTEIKSRIIFSRQRIQQGVVICSTMCAIMNSGGELSKRT